jgi:hypothetical protein
MVRRFLAAAALVLAVLGTPRTSEAGLIDFIWEMSGPQMIGAGYGCFLTTNFKREECRLHGVVGVAKPPEGAPHRGGPFLVLDGSYMFSTGKNSPTQDFDFGQVQMVMLEPGIAFRSIGESGTDRVRVYHGLGATYNILFGRDMSTFDKFGFKFTPIDVAYKRIAVAFEIRLYPNGFTDDEFGLGPRLTFDRPYETTYGFKVSLAFTPNK